MFIRGRIRKANPEFGTKGFMTAQRLLKTPMKTTIIAIIGLFLLSPFASAQEKTTIRFGHFPNITHESGRGSKSFCRAACEDVNPYALRDVPARFRAAPRTAAAIACSGARPRNREKGARDDRRQASSAVKIFARHG